MTGRAGSMESMENATVATIIAIMAMNSDCDILGVMGPRLAERPVLARLRVKGHALQVQKMARTVRPAAQVSLFSMNTRGKPFWVARCVSR